MFLEKFLAQFTWLDWVGLIWFLTCWLGYEQVVEKGWSGRKSLLEETHKLRLQWGRVMLTRNPRIVDVALINNLLQSLSFYANTSIYIIAALFAALGALDQLVRAAPLRLLAHDEPLVVVAQVGHDAVGELVGTEGETTDGVPVDAGRGDLVGDDAAGQRQIGAAREQMRCEGVA